MDLSTTIGVIFGIVLLAISIVMPSMPSYVGGFVDIPSVIIVFGGCICAVVASYPFKKLFKIIKHSGIVFSSKSKDMTEVIKEISDLATRARKDGLLSLEEAASEIDDIFFKKGVLMIVDATDPELVKSIMETELYYIDERHQEGAGVFELCANVAPAFGMVGTLIGLINMLKNLASPESLGPDMAVALVTTFYGVVLANMVFSPIAAKLKQLNDRELLEKTIILEGILSIQAGENPRIIEEKLLSFLPTSAKKANGGKLQENFSTEGE